MDIHDIQHELAEVKLQQLHREEINSLKEKNKERARNGGVTSNFSGKQKKAVLRDRKLRVQKREELTKNTLKASNPFQSYFATEEEMDTDEKINATSLSIKSSTIKLVSSLGKSNEGVDKELATYFVQETKEQIYTRIIQSRSILDLSKRNDILRSEELVQDPILNHPIRPKWTYQSTKESVEEKEELFFDNWLNKIHNKYSYEELNHFEHNLQVWRQLWRVLERSTHIVLVTDIRNPLLHIPSSLYHYVTKELSLPMIIVLNKTDLVPSSLVNEWKEFLQQKFSKCSIVCFSSRSCVGETIAERRKALSVRLNVGTIGAMNGAQEILKTCGISRDKAQQVIHSVNSAQEKENLLNEKSSRRRRQKSKTKSQKLKQTHDNLSSSSIQTCDYCGIEPAIFLCSTCTYTFEDCHLCKSCEKALHQDEVHQVVSIASPTIIEPNDETEELVNIENKISIGLVGQPNVGKSSVLNGLAGHKVASVSHTPGHTKHFQSIQIDPSITLLDCPGLVFPFTKVPRYLQEISGLFPYAQLREPFSSIRFLCEHYPLEKVLDLKPIVQEFEGIKEKMPWTPWTICEAYAEKKGYKTDRIGRPDQHRAGVELIRDVIDGILPLYFHPPVFQKKENTCHSMSMHTKKTISSDKMEKSSKKELVDEKEDTLDMNNQRNIINPYQFLDSESESDTDNEE